MTDELVKRLRAVDHMSLEDCFCQSSLYDQAADRIEALTEERDGLLRCVTDNHVALCRAEKAEAERDRLREALTELLEVSRRAVRLSVEHDNFKLYAMEPMDRAILLSRAALKGETP